MQLARDFGWNSYVEVNSHNYYYVTEPDSLQTMGQCQSIDICRALTFVSDFLCTLQLDSYFCNVATLVYYYSISGVQEVQQSS